MAIERRCGIITIEFICWWQKLKKLKWPYQNSVVSQYYDILGAHTKYDLMSVIIVARRVTPCVSKIFRSRNIYSTLSKVGKPVIPSIVPGLCEAYVQLQVLLNHFDGT